MNQPNDGKGGDVSDKCPKCGGTITVLTTSSVCDRCGDRQDTCHGGRILLPPDVRISELEAALAREKEEITRLKRQLWLTDCEEWDGTLHCDPKQPCKACELRGKVARLEALLAPLRGMAALVATQDNYATEGPIYLVQQRRRYYDAAGDEDAHVWIDGEGNEQAEEPEDTEGWHRVPVLDVWEFVQPFFTDAAAEAYIEANRHRMTDPRVYIDGSYRNGEWKAIRALLLSLAGLEGK